MSDIVERLKRGESCLKGSGQTCISMNAVNGCLCAIAADEITRLAAEVERLRSLTVVQESLIRKSEAANEKLRAALYDCLETTAKHHAEDQARAQIGGSDMALRKAKAILTRSSLLFGKIRTIVNAALKEASND